LLRVLNPSVDLSAASRAYRIAFGTSPENVARWIENTGSENFRAMGSPLQAILLDIPMGQRWGGRDVRMHGVAGVAVVPEARGVGLGTQLMTAYLAELRGNGVALSSLFASTRALYRKVGFELAGATYHHSMTTEFFSGSTALTVRELVPADYGQIERIYASRLAREAGSLVRGPYIWDRVWRARGGTSHDGFVVLQDDRITGWLVVDQSSRPDGFQNVEVKDAQALDGASWARIGALLRAFGSMSRTTKMIGGPTHPLFDVASEFRVETKLWEPWMLRLVHLEAAMRERGWPAHLSAELHLSVDDDVLPENTGAWVLAIRDGEAMLHKGGPGTIKLGIRALTRLYSGWTGAHQLAQTGLLSASAAELDLLDAAFAGPRAAIATPF